MKTFAQIRSLPMQERQAYLHSLGITSIKSVYSRVAAEHAIPLPVAEAMVRTGGWLIAHVAAVSEADQVLNNGREAQSLRSRAADDFLQLWGNLAPALVLPRPQVMDAARDALDGLMDIFNRIGDLADKFAEKEEGAACA